jgi:hypothetical protein
MQVPRLGTLRKGSPGRPLRRILVGEGECRPEPTSFRNGSRESVRDAWPAKGPPGTGGIPLKTNPSPSYVSSPHPNSKKSAIEIGAFGGSPAAYRGTDHRCRMALPKLTRLTRAEVGNQVAPSRRMFAVQGAGAKARMPGYKFDVVNVWRWIATARSLV